jgi:hypothetical protein
VAFLSTADGCAVDASAPIVLVHRIAPPRTAGPAEHRVPRWRYLGPTDVRVDAATGNLVIRLPSPGHRSRTLIEQAPIAWQDINGQRVPVAVRFDVGVNGSVGFVVGSYDTTKPLTIDPVLSYATYQAAAAPTRATRSRSIHPAMPTSPATPPPAAPSRCRARWTPPTTAALMSSSPS